MISMQKDRPPARLRNQADGLPPITEQIARVQQDLGITLTPFSTGLMETFGWYSAQTPRHNLDFTFEDKLIREARTSSNDS